MTTLTFQRAVMRDIIRNACVGANEAYRPGDLTQMIEIGRRDRDRPGNHSAEPCWELAAPCLFQRPPEKSRNSVSFVLRNTVENRRLPLAIQEREYGAPGSACGDRQCLANAANNREFMRAQRLQHAEPPAFLQSKEHSGFARAIRQALDDGTRHSRAAQSFEHMRKLHDAVSKLELLSIALGADKALRSL